MKEAKEPDQGGVEHTELAAHKTMRGRRLDCSWCETQQDNSAEICSCRLRALVPTGAQDLRDLEEGENFSLVLGEKEKKKYEACYGLFSGRDIGVEREGSRRNKWEKEG